MNPLNRSRVVAGGALAALVLIVGELGIEPLMAPDFEGWLRSLGIAPPGEEAMVAVVLLSLATGLATVWLYAAIRPRYGAGARTALLAGTAVWLLTCTLPNFAMAAYGLLPFGRLFWFATVWPLAETLAAALAGAWVYREDAGRGEPRAEMAAALR